MHQNLSLFVEVTGYRQEVVTKLCKLIGFDSHGGNGIGAEKQRHLGSMEYGRKSIPLIAIGLAVIVEPTADVPAMHELVGTSAHNWSFVTVVLMSLRDMLKWLWVFACSDEYCVYIYCLSISNWFSDLGGWGHMARQELPELIKPVNHSAGFCNSYRLDEMEGCLLFRVIPGRLTNLQCPSVTQGIKYPHNEHG